MQFNAPSPHANACRNIQKLMDTNHGTPIAANISDERITSSNVALMLRRQPKLGPKCWLARFL